MEEKDELLRIDVVTYLKEKGIRILSDEYKSKFIEYVAEQLSLADSEISHLNRTQMMIKTRYRQCKNHYKTFLQKNKTYLNHPVVNRVKDSTLESPGKKIHKKQYVNECIQIVLLVRRTIRMA